MKSFSILMLMLILAFCIIAPLSFAENPEHLRLRGISYIEKDLQELPTIRSDGDFLVENKVDELIDLLESHKKAAAEGGNIDELQKTVQQINDLIEKQKSGPSVLSPENFHNSICFHCHANGDFTPADKTRKEWRYLIEENGHAIFETIPWESPWQKKQILKFLLDHAGNQRAEGIGRWN